MSVAPRSPLWSPLGLLSASVLLALLVAELSLRIFSPVAFRSSRSGTADVSDKQLVHRRSEIPGLSYELTPGASGRLHDVPVRINSHGMRDAEPLEGSSVTRIAVLGDSYTFGYGVEQAHTYPQVLEDLLAAYGDPAVRYDVLNFGVGGYSTRDETLVLRHEVLEWKPRLVVVGYVLNDPETSPRQPLHRYFHAPRWWQRSHLLRRVSEAKLRWDVWRLGDGDRFAYLHNAKHEWRSVLDGFDAMARLTGGHGVPLMLVIFPRNPGRGGSWADYPYGWIHQQVRDAGAAAGFEVLDLLPVYERYPAERLRKAGAGLHPSELGHRLAAEAILERLVRSGRLGSSSMELSSADSIR